MGEGVEVDESTWKTGGNLEAEIVRLTSDPTEEVSTSESIVDSSGRMRTRHRCIKQGTAER